MDETNAYRLRFNGVTLYAVPERAHQQRSFTPGQRFIVDAVHILGITHEHVREMMGKLGEPNGAGVLVPKKLSLQTYSAWVTGVREMPLYRISQTVMIIEAILVEQEQASRELDAMSGGELFADVLAAYERLHQGIARLEHDEVLRVELDRHRLTWKHALRNAAERSPLQRERTQRYAQYLTKLGIGDAVDERPYRGKRTSTG
jgi:hypothetical protein